MFSFLKSVVVAFQKSSNRRPSSRVARRGSLRLESLEDRQLLSASPLVMSMNPYAAVAQTQTLVNRTSHTITSVSPITNLVSDRVFETPIIPSYTPASGASPVFYPDSPPSYLVVNDFHNVSFNMNSENGTTHQLTIQAQYDSLGSSTFTGVWDGLKSGGVAVSGSLTRYGSNTDIKFTWGDHIFMGTISGDPGAYHIEGTVYSYGAMNAPGFTVGDQVVVVPDLTGMKWKMPSGGHNFSLQIATQNNLADGTATFTGTWNDKQAVTGTLRYEADGSISIHFSWGKHQFEGTLPNDPTYYDIDGTVYSSVDGNPDGPGHLHGSRVR